MMLSNKYNSADDYDTAGSSGQNVRTGTQRLERAAVGYVNRLRSHLKVHNTVLQTTSENYSQR